MKPALPLALALVLAGCGGAPDEAAEPAATGETTVPASAPDPAQVARLDSPDCAEVVQLYLEALRGGDYALAARVWADPAVDAARLETLFGGYRELRFESTEPLVEGAAGSLYCTVAGTLSDAGDPARTPIEGTLLLRRVNDVPGATPEQRRWTVRSSTFDETLGRADGEP